MQHSICLFSEKTDDSLGCWPLDDRQISLLQSNHSKLLDLLDADDELIDALISAHFSSWQQLHYLRGFEDQRERAVKLLDLLFRRSQDNLHLFIKCVGTNQRHIVQFFTGESSGDG